MTSWIVSFLAFSIVAGVPQRPIEDRARKLLTEVATATKSTKTLVANIELTWQTPDQGLRRNIGTVKLMKPNYAVIKLTGDYPLQTLASDGATVYSLVDPTRYSKSEADAQGANINSPWWGLPFRYFFTQSINPFGPEPDGTSKTHYAGSQVVEGETFDVLETSGEKPMAYSAKFYVGSDKLIHRSVVNFGEGSQGASFSAKLTNLKTNQAMTIADFRFVLPTTASLHDPTVKLLPLGQDAPDFSLPTPEGRTLTLRDLRKGKKATLVNFWFVNCPPCRKEFEFFQVLYRKLRRKGLVVIAINKGDSARAIRDYFKKSRLTFPAVRGEATEPNVFMKYSVESYPASYLLDSEGRIVYRTTGADEAGLLLALEKLGLK
jgi:peroxiredoxin